jgi:hypothetical protein
MFTRFFDMSSGGSEKEDFCTLYVELPVDKAIEWFMKKYGHDPNNITCQCCGEDYTIDEMGENPDMVDADLIIRKTDLI